MALSKWFQLLQILNNLSMKHLIKLILPEKLLKFKRSPVKFNCRKFKIYVDL